MSDQRTVKTKPARDKYVDFLRAFSLVIVVLWHWVFTILTVSADTVSPSNPIGFTKGMWAITWLFQVMPVFFFVGGFAHRLAFDDYVKGTSRRFLRRRTKRLLVPALTLVAVWIGIGFILQATIGTSLPEALRRNPEIQRLFPNYKEIEKEYYRRTKIYPIMHLVAIRKDVFEKHPFVATSMYNALCKSKDIALKRMFNMRALRYMLPWMTAEIDEIFEIFGGDPWPYGLEPNRPTLEALVTYLHDQALIAEPVKVDDLFVPNYGQIE